MKVRNGFGNVIVTSPHSRSSFTGRWNWQVVMDSSGEHR